MLVILRGLIVCSYLRELMTPLKRLFVTSTVCLYRLFFPLLVLLSVAGKTQATITVSPLSSILDLNKTKSKMLTVFNSESNKSVAIKVSMLSWQLDENGQDIRKPTRDLLIFPEQFVLAASSRRSIRIAYSEPQAPGIEQSYRVIVQELPVDLAGNNQVQTGVTLVTSYATAFYVEPSLALSELALEEASVDIKKLYFTLNNMGNAHTHLRQAQIVIIQDEQRFIIDQSNDLKGIINENMLAGSKRHFSLIWPESISLAVDFTAPMVLELSLSCESCDTNSAVLRVPID
jgi:fimbrial chaperone protein